MSTQLTFEKIMLLHAKAVLHHEKAKKLLSLDVVGMLSEAGKQLLLAASIMDYICNLIPAAKISSQRLNKQLPNPPEVDEAVCRGKRPGATLLNAVVHIYDNDFIMNE
jgi:hypothetical protein